MKKSTPPSFFLSKISITPISKSAKGPTKRENLRPFSLCNKSIYPNLDSRNTEMIQHIKINKLYPQNKQTQE